ncbi:MAG: hypothetical protein VXZ35_02175, partial [Pseudomonadota bacterium]|nr:hypothetical protein [Pseudomonadota bacterium]
EFVQLPVGEIERRLADGSLDGDCGRDQSLEYRLKQHIIRIDPPFRQAIVTIWGDETKIDTPIAQLSIAIADDWKTFTPIVKRFGYGDVRSYPDLSDLPAAVSRGEVDAFLSYYADIAKREEMLRKAGIAYHRDVLSTPVHLYLRHEFRALVPALVSAIRSARVNDPYSSAGTPELPVRSENHLVFSCSMPPKFPLYERLRLFYTNAFKELGYGFSMIPLPRAREVAELASGRVDGTCGRGLRPAFLDNRQLIKVDVAIGRSSKQMITTVAGIQSIEDIPSGTEVYYVRGTQSSNRFLVGNPDFHAKGVNTIENGIKMLAAGRIEYLVDTSVLLSNVKDYLQLDQDFYRLNLSRPNQLYPYLNRRHSGLAEPLKRQMQKQLAVWPNQLLFDDSLDY